MTQGLFVLSRLLQSEPRHGVKARTASLILRPVPKKQSTWTRLSRLLLAMHSNRYRHKEACAQSM